MKNIAVLITCFNRAETTLRCLKTLFEQEIPEEYHLEVFLVDDASPDHTGERVKQAFPVVHVIHGSGGLFWCGGMRLAWKTAAQSENFDFYLWLNDDVSLNGDALRILLEDVQKLPCPAILGGCFYDPDTDEIFYGAPEIRDLPGDAPVEVFGPMNGNLVLIPREVFRKIGGMSEKFTHQYGDFEYAIRAHRAGFRTFVAHKGVGTCKANPGFDKTKLLQMSFRRRCAMINHPKGYGLMDYCRYKCYAKGWFGAMASFCKGILILFVPGLVIRKHA